MHFDTDLLDQLNALARVAGEKILAIYDTHFDVTHKADNSPLTDADLASHHTIVDALTQLTPDIPILSEESATIAFSERTNWHRYWLIDPLDGTKEFVKRNGEFTVNIALIEQHEPVLGIVYCPVKDILYTAGKGLGAFKQDAHGKHAIHVSQTLNTPIRVVGSRSHGGDQLADIFGAIGPYELITLGSSLKICLVAEGMADIYPRLGPTSEWDTAAAHAIVLEAGGALTQTDQSALRYNTKDSLLNPYFLVYGDHHIPWKTHFASA